MIAREAPASSGPAAGESPPTSQREARHRLTRWRRIIAAFITLALLGSAAVAVNLLGPWRPSTAAGFIVDVHGERFVIHVTDPETIRLAQENLEVGNGRFPAGGLGYGDGGFNAPWSWHLRPDSVRMVDHAIEVCDGRPSDVEQNLTYWVETVGAFCPWAGRIIQVLGA